MSDAFEKRIKKHIIGKPHRFLAVSPLGFEQTLVRELEFIQREARDERRENFQEGALLRSKTQNIDGSSAIGTANQPHVTGDGKVEFTAKITEAWKVVAYSRIANRVLMEVANFKAENFRELEKKAAEIPWELYLDERRETRDERLESRPTELGMTELNGWDLSEANGSTSSPTLTKIQRRETTTIQGERFDKHTDLNKSTCVFSSNSEQATSNSIHIHVTCKHSRLYHSDAIAERLYNVITQSMPQSEANSSGAPIPQNFYVDFLDDRCTIWLDLAGEELYKRGFKRFVNDAPLKETIAAGMLFEAIHLMDPISTSCLQDDASGAPAPHILPPTSFCLLDLMSGSGTFSLEAACIANKIIPGICRDFALKHQPAFKEATWNFITRSVTQNETKGPVKSCKAFTTVEKILTSDISERAVSIIKHNIECSPLASVSPTPILPRHYDFFNYTANEIADACGEASPILVLNPPYGKRLHFDAPKLYTKIGKKIAELAHDLKSSNKRLTVAILVPKDDNREGSKYTCTANFLHECPAMSPMKNPAAKQIITSHGGFSLNVFIAVLD